MVSIGAVIHALLTAKATLRRMASRGSKTKSQHQHPPLLNPAPAPGPSAPWSAVRDADDVSTIAAALAPRAPNSAPFPSFPPPVASPLPARPTAVRAPFDMSARPRGEWVMPSITMLTEPKKSVGAKISQDALEQNARLLEGVLDDFGVKGEIVNVRPGPVVALYVGKLPEGNVLLVSSCSKSVLLAFS